MGKIEQSGNSQKRNPYLCRHKEKKQKSRCSKHSITQMKLGDSGLSRGSWGPTAVQPPGQDRAEMYPSASLPTALSAQQSPQHPNPEGQMARWSLRKMQGAELSGLGNGFPRKELRTRKSTAVHAPAVAQAVVPGRKSQCLACPGEETLTYTCEHTIAALWVGSDKGQQDSGRGWAA